MKLYVINLARSPGRLHRLEKLFRQQKLKLARIMAVDANTICDADYAALTARQWWPEPLTRGEVACFLSHRLVLQHIAQGPDAYGAVFEDDVALSSRAQMFLTNDHWIPAGTDLVKIETQPGKKVWLGPPTVIMGGFSLAKLKSTHIMAAAYIVSRHAAAYLAGQMEQAWAPFDHFLFSFDYGIAANLKIYQLDPTIAIQAQLTSTLEDDRVRQTCEKKRRRTPMQTLQREIRRIGIRSRTGLRGLKINLTGKEKWKCIPFDKKF